MDAFIKQKLMEYLTEYEKGWFDVSELEHLTKRAIKEWEEYQEGTKLQRD